MLSVVLFLLLHLVAASKCFDPEVLSSLAFEMAKLDNEEWMSASKKELARKLSWMKHVHWVHSTSVISRKSIFAAMDILDAEIYCFYNEYLSSTVRLPWAQESSNALYKNRCVVTPQVVETFRVRKSLFALFALKSSAFPTDMMFLKRLEFFLKLVEIQDLIIKSLNSTELESVEKISDGFSITASVSNLQRLLLFPFGIERLGDHLEYILQSNAAILTNALDVRRQKFSESSLIPLALYRGMYTATTDLNGQRDTWIYARKVITNARKLLKGGKYTIELIPDTDLLYGEAYRTLLKDSYINVEQKMSVMLHHCDTFQMRLQNELIPSPHLDYARRALAQFMYIKRILDFVSENPKDRFFNLSAILRIIAQSLRNIFKGLNDSSTNYPRHGNATSSEQLEGWSELIDYFDSLLIEHWNDCAVGIMMIHQIDFMHLVFTFLRQFHEEHKFTSEGYQQVLGYQNCLCRRNSLLELLVNYVSDNGIAQGSFEEYRLYLEESLNCVARLERHSLTFEDLKTEHVDLYKCAMKDKRLWMFIKDYKTATETNLNAETGVRNDPISTQEAVSSNSSKPDMVRQMVCSNTDMVNISTSETEASDGLSNGAVDKAFNVEAAVVKETVGLRKIVKAKRKHADLPNLSKDQSSHSLSHDPSLASEAAGSSSSAPPASCESNSATGQPESLTEPLIVAVPGQPKPEDLAVRLDNDSNAVSTGSDQALDASEASSDITNQSDASDEPEHASIQVEPTFADESGNAPSHIEPASAMSTEFLNYLVHIDDLELLKTHDVRDILFAYLVIGNRILVRHLSPFMNYLSSQNINCRVSFNTSPSLLFQDVRAILLTNEDLIQEAMAVAQIPDLLFLRNCLMFYERRLSIAHPIFPSSKQSALKIFKNSVKMMSHARHPDRVSGYELLESMRLIKPDKPKCYPAFPWATTARSRRLPPREFVDFVISLLVTYSFCHGRKNIPYSHVSLTSAHDLRKDAAHSLATSRKRFNAVVNLFKTQSTTNF